MAKAARGVDAKLARMRSLRTDPVTPQLLGQLRDALADKSNFVAAAAAEIVGERSLTDLVPDLAAAFRRFLEDPVETDKTCRAKIAIVEALHKLDADEEELYRVAVKLVQSEPAWGPPEDTAVPLRATAAFALVRVNPRDLMVLLADLLADKEKGARSAAAKALGASGALAAIPLLRFKARVGDEEPEVVVECLSGLMSADPAESLEFVAGFLDADEEVAEGAALALGESRRPEALAVLQKHWPRARRDESLGNVVLLAMAITRLPAAVDFLIHVLASEGEPAAAGALAALAIHRHNPALRDRVAAAVAKKGPGLKKMFEKEFRAEG
jgi:HEAT repeat protein